MSSWITGLAGRAENILNKLDQNAATVLQQQQQNDKQDNTNSITNNNIIPSSSINHHHNYLLTPTKKTSSKFTSISPKSMPGKTKDDHNYQLQIEINSNNSNKSSRRSSITSRGERGEEEEDEEGSIVTAVEENLPLAPISIKQTSSSSSSNNEYELAAFKIALVEMKTERNQLRNELNLLKKQLIEATGETQITELNKIITNMDNEIEKLNFNLNEANQNNKIYLEKINNLEINLIVCQKQCNELQENLKWKIKEIEQIKSDLEKYRKKAQATLQLKDKIIDELKKTNIQKIDSSDESGVAATTDKIYEMEINNFKQELILKSNEIKLLQEKLDQTERRMVKQEQKYEEFTSNELTLKANFKIEQDKAYRLESEYKVLQQELNAVRQESQKQIQSLSEQLHTKDQRITKLQKRSLETTSHPVNCNTLEGKITSLTQALFEKQTDIETITAERNALKLQMEKLQEQLRRGIYKNPTSHLDQIIDVNDTDDVKLQLPLIMRANPFDTRVARRVKKAYSSLDKTGIKIGVFLRRYPLMRILAFVYIVLLHLWVMFILLSSSSLT